LGGLEYTKGKVKEKVKEENKKCVILKDSKRM
jgi:hypothetical protein